MSCSRSYLGEYVDLSKIPIWRSPLSVNYLIMDVLRSSDLFSRQSVVSNQLCYLICADDKLGCSWCSLILN